MYKHFAGALVAAAIPVLCAAGGTPAHADTTQVQSGSCQVVYFPVTSGMGIDVLCSGTSGMYQAVAQCANGADFWQSWGTPGYPGMGPSVATCEGNLLFPATVISYFVNGQ